MSKIFNCSRQRAMHLAQEVLREMKLRKENVDTGSSTILASRGWNFLSSSKEIEITMYADENRVEVAVDVQPRMKALDFGTSEYIEEDFLLRMRDRLN